MSLILKFIFMEPRQPREPQRPQRPQRRVFQPNEFRLLRYVHKDWKTYPTSLRMDIAVKKVLDYAYNKYKDTDKRLNPFTTEFGTDLNLTDIFFWCPYAREAGFIQESPELSAYSCIGGFGRHFYWKIFGKYIGIHKGHWRVTTEDEINSIILFMIDYWFANHEIYPDIRLYFPHVDYQDIKDVFADALRANNIMPKQLVYPQHRTYVGMHAEEKVEDGTGYEYEMFLVDTVENGKNTYGPYPDTEFTRIPPMHVAVDRHRRPKSCAIVDELFGDKMISLVSDYLNEVETARLKSTCVSVEDALKWQKEIWYDKEQPFTKAEFNKHRPILKRLSDLAPYVNEKVVEQINSKGEKIKPFHHYVRWAEFELFVLKNYPPDVVGYRYEMMQRLRNLWNQNVENAKKNKSK